MATNIIMPALEMAQESGKILRWLKPEGASVSKGEPIMEIETDKVTVEIEAPASGLLSNIAAREGDTVPVGQTIAWVLAPGESAPNAAPAIQSGRTISSAVEINASPVARRIAEEQGLDLALVKPEGGRIEKADVLSFIEKRDAQKSGPDSAHVSSTMERNQREGRILASPKARRLAVEQGIDLGSLRGSGPDGAVLAADIPAALPRPSVAVSSAASPSPAETLSTVWRVMAERMTASWTSVPHFYLLRDVDASGLVEMRKRITPLVEKRSGVKPTFTDLLIKMTAMVLLDHPRLNASWASGSIQYNHTVHLGLATAIQDGLIVPVIHHTASKSIGEIAVQRRDLVDRANGGKLRPPDISGGTFTLTNLGMYNVHAFIAIINAPQAAILATGRIADRVVAVDGQPAVRPMMMLSLSCDHRVVDGARAASFLDDLSKLIEEPWGLLA